MPCKRRETCKVRVVIEWKPEKKAEKTVDERNTANPREVGSDKRKKSGTTIIEVQLQWWPGVD